MKKSVQKGQFLPTYIGLKKMYPKIFYRKSKKRLFTFIERPDHRNAKKCFLSNSLSSVGGKFQKYKESCIWQNSLKIKIKICKFEKLTIYLICWVFFTSIKKMKKDLMRQNKKECFYLFNLYISFLWCDLSFSEFELISGQ